MMVRVALLKLKLRQKSNNEENKLGDLVYGT
jgi:hypothetical protein